MTVYRLPQCTSSNIMAGILCLLITLPLQLQQQRGSMPLVVNNKIPTQLQQQCGRKSLLMID